MQELPWLWGEYVSKVSKKNFRDTPYDQILDLLVESDVTENDIFSHWHCAYLDNILRDDGAGKYIIYTNLPNCLSICNERQTFLTPEREQNASD